MFVHTKEMPNGAIAQFHKAVRFEVYADATHAVVNSYRSAAMEMVSWQDTYVIPVLLKIESLADVESILTAPGAPFEGGTVILADQGDLVAAKALARGLVKSRRDQAEWAGVMTPYGPIDTDPAAQRKVNGNVTMAMILGDAFTTEFRMWDDKIRPLDHDQMIEVGLIVGQHVGACQANKNLLDALINGAADAAELSAIDLSAGWPEPISI